MLSPLSHPASPRKVTQDFRRPPGAQLRIETIASRLDSPSISRHIEALRVRESGHRKGTVFGCPVHSSHAALDAPPPALSCRAELLHPGELSRPCASRTYARQRARGRNLLLFDLRGEQQPDRQRQRRHRDIVASHDAGCLRDDQYEGQ